MLPAMNDPNAWGSLGGSLLLPQGMDWMGGATLSLVQVGESVGPLGLLGSLIGSPNAAAAKAIANSLVKSEPSLDLTLGVVTAGKGVSESGHHTINEQKHI